MSPQPRKETSRAGQAWPHFLAQVKPRPWTPETDGAKPNCPICAPVLGACSLWGAGGKEGGWKGEKQ